MLKLNREDREALEWAKRAIGMPDLTDRELLDALRGTGDLLKTISGERYNPDQRAADREREKRELEQIEDDEPLGVVGYIQNGRRLTDGQARTFRRMQENRQAAAGQRAGTPVLNRSEPLVSPLMSALLAKGLRERREAEKAKLEAHTTGDRHHEH
jgi:hypothetical protein